MPAIRGTGLDNAFIVVLAINLVKIIISHSVYHRELVGHGGRPLRRVFTRGRSSYIETSYHSSAVTASLIINTNIVHPFAHWFQGCCLYHTFRKMREQLGCFLSDHRSPSIKYLPPKQPESDMSPRLARSTRIKHIVTFDPDPSDL